MIDLSYLTEEEQSMIMTVLKRDEQLKQAEEERVRQLQKNNGSVERRLKYLTGEWFYVAKSQRHSDKIHGSKIILASMKPRKADCLDVSPSRMEKPRVVSNKVSELTPPPKPARLLETQLKKNSESLSLLDAKKDTSNSVVRSPGRPRHNPFNRASFELEAETMDGVTNEDQDDKTSYKTEPVSPLRSHTAKESSLTSAGSVTSEGSSLGFRPVPKKRTFLSRHSQSSHTDSDVSIPGQPGRPIEPKVTSRDPEGSVQPGPSGGINQPGQDLVDKQSQKLFPKSDLQNNVSLASQQLNILSDRPYKPINCLTLVPTTTELDREIGSHEQQRTADKPSDDTLIRPRVINPSPPKDTESSTILVTAMTEPKPHRLSDFTPVTHSDNDRRNEKYYTGGQTAEGSDPPKLREWSDGKFSEPLFATSERTAPAHHQPSQHAAFEILEMQDKETIRSRNVGTATRQEDLNLDPSTLDQRTHRERLNSRDRPENQVHKKTGGHKPAIKSAPLSPQSTGEEGDSIAKVLEWFSRSQDSNDWLDTQDDQPDMEEGATDSKRIDTEDRPGYESRSQREREDSDLKKVLSRIDPNRYTQAMKGVSILLSPEVESGSLSESSVEQLPNNSALRTIQPKRRMSEADRCKGNSKKEPKQIVFDREEDVTNFTDPAAEADVSQGTTPEVKQNEEVQEDENQSPNISQLKSLWEMGNSGPNILTSRQITEKVQEPIEKQTGKEVAEHVSVAESESGNGLSSKNLLNGKENKGLNLDTQPKAIGGDVSSVQPGVNSDRQEVCTPRKAVVTSPTLEILTLPTSWDDGYAAGALSEENKTITANLDKKELQTSLYTTDRRGSEAGTHFQSTLNPQQETLSMSGLITHTDSMLVTRSRLTPASKINSASRLTPDPRLLIQPRVKPQPGKLPPDLPEPQAELLSSSGLLPDLLFQSTESESLPQAGQQKKVSENVLANVGEQSEVGIVQSVVSRKQLDQNVSDEGSSPNTLMQISSQQDSKAEKIKNLKSFWEQGKNRPILISSKSNDGEAKGKLSKRLSKSEFDLLSVCNDSDNIHEGDCNQSSENQKPRFNVFTMDQRLEKSTPVLGTNRLQFKSLCDFWGEAASRGSETVSTEKPKSPKKKEQMNGQNSSLEIKHSLDTNVYGMSSPSDSQKVNTRSPLDESSLISSSSTSPSSLSPRTSLVSGNKARRSGSESRSIGVGTGALTDTKANISSRIAVEQQRTPCVPQVRSVPEQDLTKEEKTLQAQSTSGKGSSSRKDSFGNSSGSGRGRSFRRVTSMFTLDMNDNMDQTALIQPKNTMDIGPVQPKIGQQSSDKEPYLRRSSKSSDESESLTPRARAFIPSDNRHYLGLTEKTGVHTMTSAKKGQREIQYPDRAELNLGSGPVRSSTPLDSEECNSMRSSKVTQHPLALWSNHGSTDTGRESSFSTSERASSSASETWSISRTSSNRENDDDDQISVQEALNRAQTRPRNLTKSLEDITASMPPRQDRRLAPRDDLKRGSDASTLPSPSSSLISDPENMKKMSKSVPSFLQEEIDGGDTDSAEDSYHGSKHKMGKSMTNLSSSSGMTSLSGSVMTMYSGDYGGVVVQGNIEFSISYIQKLREFHIFVARSRNLSAVDPKRGRSDPYVKSYLVPDKANLGKRKTSVKKKTVNPVFNEILRYRVRMDYLQTQTLILSVWHHDTFGRNSFLGEVDVDLSKWDFGQSQMNLLDLKARPSSTLQPSDHRGEMRLAIRFLPYVSHSLGKDSLSSTGEVHIWVKDCKNLPLIRGASINPYVKCFVLPDTSRKSRQKTRVLRRTVEPVFNHTMVYDGFKQEDLMEACVELTVWDNDRLGSNLMGGLRLGPGTGRSYGAAVDWMDSNPEEVKLWERMMSSPNEWVAEVLPLRMLTAVKTKLR
ncbi:hypothetical protein DPEC_G00245280 [Dallia pectoralis]|uniref:Uncharacterized protein n=1 Tax=Dallia pectoralis TaxID=75939 RepID=A0ACC2FW92_DALPE|nr:hypothetical protein DPEC_G00245280 [Dallia pectoralis]